MTVEPLRDPAPESLSTVIYEEMRRRIIRGDYPPGTRLRERDLAADLQVSRIPLREAIPQLQAEGFVTSLPRRGAIVTVLTMRDAYELFEVRLGVEVYANRLAAERVADGADPAPVQSALEDCHAAVAAGELVGVSEASAALHQAIIDLADNSLMKSMLRTATGRHRWIYQMTGGSDPGTAMTEHEHLCNAICAGDPELAQAFAYGHIARGRGPTLAALQKVLPASPRVGGHRHSPPRVPGQ